MRRAIVDTGPLVAFLDRAEQYHRWVVEQVEELEPPLLVCEPVLAEAMHLLARFSRGQDALLGLLETGALKIVPHRGAHSRAAQAASKISGQADVACRCVRRANDRNLRAARRADARFRFHGVSQTWPRAARAHLPSAEVAVLTSTYAMSAPRRDLRTPCRGTPGPMNLRGLLPEVREAARRCAPIRHVRWRMAQQRDRSG